MVIETINTQLSYFQERYDNNMPDLSGNKMIISGETVYWYKFFHHHLINTQTFSDQTEINLLLNYFNSLPSLFGNANVIERGNILPNDQHYIHLNQFVCEIRDCRLPFIVIGHRKRIL